MPNQIQWTQSKKVNGPFGKVWELYFAPSFLDLSKTEFPEGLLLSFDGQDDSEQLAIAEESVKHFFNCMIEDYQELKIDDKEFLVNPKWTSILHDVPPFAEEIKLKAYIRLVPDIMDCEYAGYSWGLSVLNKFYDDEQDASFDRAKVERFMNQVLVAYDAIA